MGKETAGAPAGPVPMTESFWLESIGKQPPRSPWRGDGRVDVAIVGGGFTGISTALHIKERRPELRVVVLEGNTVAWGASGRNAGFSMTLFGLELGITAFRFGKARAKEADDYMVKAVEYTRELVRRHDIDCDYEEHGMVTVATNANQYKRLYKQFELAQKLGLHDTEWFDGPRVREWVDSPTYLGGWHDPLCALVNPAKLAVGMARTAEAAGVEIFEYSPVQALHPGAPVTLEIGGRGAAAGVEAGVGVRAGAAAGADSGPGTRFGAIAGRIRADRVVLATNAFTSVFPQLRRTQAPVHTYIVLTEPLTDKQIEAIGWRKRIGVEDGRNLIHYYRLTPDNRLLMGGHDIAYYYGNRTDGDHHRDIAERIQDHVRWTFPGLRDVKFTHHWGGPISVSLDMVPAIGRLGGNVFYSVGCMGHGVSLTQLNGRTLADLVLDTPSELTEAFFVGRKVIPLPPEPLRFPVIQAIAKVFRLQDRWDARRGSGAAAPPVPGSEAGVQRRG